MKISSIIHQQIYQLKWYILACFGIIMILPIEEVIGSFWAETGFSGIITVHICLLFAPLLAGLIACANIQGDLQDKRYTFWRSKPAGIKKIMSLKYFVGLIISLFILFCPVFFGIIITAFSRVNISELGLDIIIPLSVLLTLMTYSLCFASNSLVRNTARSWLIGMLLAGFLLVLPFILPLNYTDFMNIYNMPSIYPVIMVIASVTAFIFSLFAAQFNWHLRTNLKGLLWVVAGLVFTLLMLFSSQVANIKVLHEKEIESYDMSWIISSLDYVGDKVAFAKESFINIDDNVISFEAFKSSPVQNQFPLTNIEGYKTSIIPPRSQGGLIKQIGDALYSFSITAYHLRRNSDRNPIYEKAYLRSYKYTENTWSPINELDISDFIVNTNFKPIAMRLIDDKIYIFISGRNIIVADITNPQELKLIETKLDVLKTPILLLGREQEEFTVPLLPIDNIEIEERIRLSIDWNFHYPKNHESSIVDIYDDKITFFPDYHNMELTCCNVISWDNEKIYCKFNNSRRLTILEELTDTNYGLFDLFVKDGKLYCLGSNSLMVFDIRTNKMITKLGHFVRMNYDIRDIAVADNGNIILYMRSRNLSNFNQADKNFLCLLQAP